MNDILYGRVTGIPLFIAALAMVFYLSFDIIGGSLSDMLSVLIGRLTDALSLLLLRIGADPIAHGLVIDGICSGIGSVLSFVPVVSTLFFLLSVLEESGYLPAMASVLDGPMSRIGLSGRCVVPLVMGFGCAVPAVMAAGNMLDGRERDTVIAMIPFMSCSAKLPIYAVFITAFFEGHRAFIMTALYIIGVLISVLYALFLSSISRHARRSRKARGRKAARDDHCHPRNAQESRKARATVKNLGGMNAPSRAPGIRARSLKSPRMRPVFLTVYINVKGFVRKAFTVILVASVVIWTLRSFDTGLNAVTDIEDSMLALFGKLIAPIFAPLGFGDWRAASAVIAGLTAKEAVVSTFAIMAKASSGAGAPLTPLLSDIFSPLSAFSFMVFCLLYVPCAAALAAVKLNTGSAKCCLEMILIHIVLPWAAAYAVYALGNLLFSLF